MVNVVQHILSKEPQDAACVWEALQGKLVAYIAIIFFRDLNLLFFKFRYEKVEFVFQEQQKKKHSGEEHFVWLETDPDSFVDFKYSLL